jgi:hypothetical protein
MREEDHADLVFPNSVTMITGLPVKTRMAASDRCQPSKEPRGQTVRGCQKTPAITGVDHCLAVKRVDDVQECGMETAYAERPSAGEAIELPAIPAVKHADFGQVHAAIPRSKLHAKHQHRL